MNGYLQQQRDLSSHRQSRPAQAQLELTCSLGSLRPRCRLGILAAARLHSLPPASTQGAEFTALPSLLQLNLCAPRRSTLRPPAPAAWLQRQRQRSARGLLRSANVSSSAEQQPDLLEHACAARAVVGRPYLHCACPPACHATRQLRALHRKAAECHAPDLAVGVSLQDAPQDASPAEGRMLRREREVSVQPHCHAQAVRDHEDGALPALLLLPDVCAYLCSQVAQRLPG